MIIFDLDGVLVNFCGAAYKIHGREHNLDAEPTEFDFFLTDPWNITADEFWAPINDAGPEWWATIPQFSWTDHLISLAASYDNLAVATACSHHAHSAMGKVVAMQAMFGSSFRDYFITPRKWYLGREGTVLIDDLESNCKKFEEYGGSAILFPQPYNSNKHHIGDRLGYVRQQLEHCKEYGIFQINKSKGCSQHS